MKRAKFVFIWLQRLNGTHSSVSVSKLHQRRACHFRSTIGEQMVVVTDV